MPSNAEIRRITQEYLDQAGTPVTSAYLDKLVDDVREKMLSLKNIAGRDSVREAIASVLTSRKLRVWLAEVDGTS